MTRKAGRRPITVLWLFCEGRTESGYFNQLKQTERISRLKIKPKETGAKNANRIVQDAIAHMRSAEFSDGDIIACVFDVDSNTDAQLREAHALARKNGIINSFSNPCFEYWVLCHYEFFQGRSDAADLISRLKRHMKDYEKPCPELYSKTKDKIKEARKNASKILAIHSKEGRNPLGKDANPLTLIFQLIEKIDDFKDE